MPIYDLKLIKALLYLPYKMAISQKQQKVSFIQKCVKCRGQISILMALIFPVLFVFFAMTINIGLLVHDKINLQNSVDLAVYYGATKQAEILNAIAHINYQLRQNWKLLAFRLRGFGDFGSENHPWLLNSKVTGTFSDNDDWRPLNNPKYPGEPSPVSVCTQVGENWMQRYVGDRTINRKRKDFACNKPDSVISGVPITQAVQNAPFTLLAEEFEEYTVHAQKKGMEQCISHGASNWFTASVWFFAYKYNLIIRKIAIEKLAELLEKGQDLSGKKIEAGVKKTFENNLTRSNRDAVRNDDVHWNYFNSMKDINRSAWLVETPLLPFIYYTDSEYAGGGRGGSDPNCTYIIKLLENEPYHFTHPTYNNTLVYDTDRYQVIKEHLRYLTAVEPPMGDPGIPIENTNMHISIASMVSYEKNPWYMVYSGLNVQLEAGNRIFSPFKPGSPTLKAKAFAKPFGGRIGPWMFPTWPEGSRRSQNNNNPIDMMLQPIIRDENGDANTASLLDPNRVPNYSRFPGDEFGLNSQKALGVFRYLIDQMSHIDLSYNDFLKESILPSLEDLGNPGQQYDPLAWDPINQDPKAEAPKSRVFEVLSVAPDLFDITYYSIDPQFHKNHSNLIDLNLKFVTRAIDLGNKPGSQYDGFNVLDQWAWMHDIYQGGILPPYPLIPGIQIGRHGEWFVKKWTHLLTGWIPEKMRNDKFFGSCTDKGDLTKKTSESLPGSCGIGGRMGYSVKLVSERYLKSDLPLGGANTSGTIINPPDSL